MFETTKSFDILQGRVPNFSKGDVTFAVLIGDEIGTKIPKKGTGFKYVARDDACTNGAKIRWNEDEWAPLVLNLDASNTVCTLKFDSIYNSITVDGVNAKEFPEKGDYQVNMGCTNVGSASWDFNAWQPNISGITTNSSCNVVFKSTNSVITKVEHIKKDKTREDITERVRNEGYNYLKEEGKRAPKVECVGGGVGSWDNAGWKPIVTNVTNSTTCTVTFRDSALNGSDPVIKNGLVPVTIANNGTVTKSSETANDWFDYDTSKWANAVILNGADTYSVGATIPDSAIKGYFVWIPKYRYKLWTTGTDSTAKLIEIEFNSENTTNSNTECIATNVAGNVGTCSAGKWMTHPAFTSLGVNGIWVGKFETTGTTSAPTVKPNIASLRSIDGSTMYNTAYNFNRGLDSHMMKNTEWGAMAYLTNSKYGRGNSEVWINTSSTGITGCAGSSVSDNLSSSGCKNAYNTATGYHASTTDNISGIYDTSGGSGELVMGNLNKVAHDSGLTPSSIADRYIDRYTAESVGNKILGDATGETNGWNVDNKQFLNYEGYWLIRGGWNFNITSAGIFSFNRRAGGANSYDSFRVVLSPA